MNRLLPAAAAVFALAGCATFSEDGGINTVNTLARERGGQAVVAQRSAAETDLATARTAELLQQELSAESAVEAALLGNRGLQARLAELGIVEAERVRAGRLRNPSFGFGRMREGGGAVEVERSVMFDLLGLLTLPWRQELGLRRFEQAQLQAATDVVTLATEVRRAWFEAVSADELARYHQRVQDAADAAGELARRMQAAGNFSTLEQLREQAFQADAAARVTRARQQALAAREHLVRLLGAPVDGAALKLPAQLPPLPAEAAPRTEVAQAALDRRLDLMLARHQAEGTARSLGLTRATGFVNVLELGYQNRSATGAPLAEGFEIELELPLFDFGNGTRAAEAEALYRQALHRAADATARARSQLREADAAYRSAHALARHHRDELVPLRKRISDEQLLRYNGMLIGVFELLADAREQVQSVTAAVEALRDFWLAETTLQAALAGVPSTAAANPTTATAPAAQPAAGH